ncbi:M6PR [Branchiostoma lanceolatum]|uniref:Autophagy-related protein 27 n=1 Tax=Branchiostoma lanceolatum TaxID=7740 RepID=A0A8J9WFU6_BRALA|nr:M6PR [Branchiostoma lanceolatum]
MEGKLFLQIFFLQLLGHFLVFGQQQCTKSGACSCTMSDGKVVDLEPLAGTDGQPRFINQDGTTFFYYNPCTPFKKGDSGECQGEGLAACQYDGNGYYDIGDQSSLATSYDTSTGGVIFSYTSGQSQRRSVVNLVCTASSTPTFTAKESPAGSGIFVMTISSLCVCPGRSKDCNAAGAAGLSAGSTMCILLTVFVLVYVAGGMLFLRFARGAEGTEMIPNYEFWADFPHLVKDGFTFATRPCRGEEAYAYEKI